MSKGYGKVQHQIIAYLQAQPRTQPPGWKRPNPLGWPGWTAIRALTHDLAFPDETDSYTSPTRAQIESTRRAALKLASAGLAETALIRLLVSVRRPVPWAERTYANDTYLDDGDRWCLAIRPVLTDDERAAEAADKTNRMAAAAALLAALR